MLTSHSYMSSAQHFGRSCRSDWCHLHLPDDDKMRTVIFTSGERSSIEMAGRTISGFKRLGLRRGFDIDVIKTAGQLRDDRGFGLLLSAMQSEAQSALLCPAEQVPSELPEDTRMAIIQRRLKSSDCIVSEGGYTRLKSGSGVACQHVLRRAQMLRVRRDLRVSEVTLDSESMLLSVERGENAACVLPSYEFQLFEFAGKGNLRASELPLDYFVPAAGQGAFVLLTMEAEFPERAVKRMDDQQTRREITIERKVVNKLSPAPGVPLGVNCTSFGSGYRLHVQLLSSDGTLERRIAANIAGRESLSEPLSRFRDDVSRRLLKRLM